MGFDETVCFTFDLDWAPEPMVDELAQLLDQFSLPSTVFCTHTSPAVERLLRRPRCQVGIHPNLIGQEDPEVVLEQIRALFPDARIVRNHGLFYHSYLLAWLHRAGIHAMSNELEFLRGDLKPWYDWSGLIRLPIYWEDDVHMVYFDGDCNPDHVALDVSGLKVLSFHPVHLWLNTSRMRDYDRVKQVIPKEEKLESLRMPGQGIRTLFEAIARRVRSRELATLAEVTERFSQRESYQGHYDRFLREKGTNAR